MCLNKTLDLHVHNMDGLKKKLTRSLSGPRRCTFCQKMVYFSSAKCKVCGDLAHRNCVQHATHQETKKCLDGAINPITADGALWCSSDHVTSKNRTLSDSSYDYDESRQRPGVAMSSLLKIVRWLSHRKKAKELSCKSSASEKHVKGKFGLKPKGEDKEAKKKLKSLLKNTQSYQRQLSVQPQTQKTLPFQKQRSLSARLAPSSSSMRCQRRLCRSFAIRGTDANVPAPKNGFSSYNEFSSPFVVAKNDHGEANPTSSGNNEQITSRLDTKEQTSPISPTQETPAPSFLGWTPLRPLPDSCKTQRKTPLVGGAANLQPLSKHPCIGKAKTLSLESRNRSDESLCATWPPLGKTATIMEESDEEEFYTAEDHFRKNKMAHTLSSECRHGENIREWCIPFDDLEFRERIRNGRQGDIYRGRWYGDVLIYTIHQSNSSDLRQFMDDVSQMGMIRHENIVLFMGACIEPQKLAVITSMRKGPTLYECVHLKRNRLPFQFKLSTARQIAQGLGYLHAKGITHRRLNSKNIILESRVKLCMMDYGMLDKKTDRNNCGCISRGQLSYLAPELMRSLTVEPPEIYPQAPYTLQSDVFAFGSLLFEVLAERFAFHDQHPHAVIWKVSTGKRGSLDSLRFISGLKTLIRKCWSQTPTNRPAFAEIVNILESSVSQHKRHSSSVPDKLQYAGSSLRRSICN